MEDSYLLGPFVSYEDIVVLRIWSQGLHSQHVILFLTYIWVQKARALHYKRLERHPKDKHDNLLGPFVIYKGIEALLSMRFCDDTSPVETQLYKTFLSYQYQSCECLSHARIFNLSNLFLSSLETQLPTHKCEFRAYKCKFTTFKCKPRSCYWYKSVLFHNWFKIDPSYKTFYGQNWPHSGKLVCFSQPVDVATKT